MKLQTIRILAAGSVFAAATAVSTVSVHAQTTTAAPQTYQVNLTQLNKSNASGTATVTANGNNLTVKLNVTGLSPNLAHAIHIHAGGQNLCNASDSDKDSYIGVKEANTANGALKVSLTTSGDTSNASGLVLDRMPKADAKGNLSYNRTFAMPSGVKASDLQKSAIDVHGIASLFDNRSTYDGSKRSDADNKLPFETTAPAACGVLSATPVGGANTGAGAASGIEQPGMLLGGGLAIVGGAAALLYSRRLAAQKIANK